MLSARYRRSNGRPTGLANPGNVVGQFVEVGVAGLDVLAEGVEEIAEQARRQQAADMASPRRFERSAPAPDRRTVCHFDGASAGDRASRGPAGGRPAARRRQRVVGPERARGVDPPTGSHAGAPAAKRCDGKFVAWWSTGMGRRSTPAPGCRRGRFVSLAAAALAPSRSATSCSNSTTLSRSFGSRPGAARHQACGCRPAGECVASSAESESVGKSTFAQP